MSGDTITPAPTLDEITARLLADQTDEIRELREQGFRDTRCIQMLETWNTKLVNELIATRRALAEAQGTTAPRSITHEPPRIAVTGA